MYFFFFTGVFYWVACKGSL